MADLPARARAAWEWLDDYEDRIWKWFWLVMFIPSFLFWRESVMLVLFCSLYANWKTSKAADEARQANKASQANKSSD